MSNFETALEMQKRNEAMWLDLQLVNKLKGCYNPIHIKWSKETAESYFSSYNVQPRRKQWYKRTQVLIKTRNNE